MVTLSNRAGRARTRIRAIVVRRLREASSDPTGLGLPQLACVPIRSSAQVKARSFGPCRQRGEEPDRQTNRDWANSQRKPLHPRAHVGKTQSGDQHSDPKQIIDKLNCSHYRHILAMQRALVNDFDHHECHTCVMLTPLSNNALPSPLSAALVSRGYRCNLRRRPFPRRR